MKKIIYLLISINIILFSSCKNSDNNAEESFQLSINDIAGEWVSESDGYFLVIGNNHTFKSYCANDMLESGTILLESNIAKGSNGFNQNYTAFQIISCENGIIKLNITYFSTIDGLEKKKTLTLKKKGDSLSALNFSYVGYSVDIFTHRRNNILGPGEILTTVYNQYTIEFQDNFKGVYSKSKWYASRPNNITKDSFIINYIYYNDKLYVIEKDSSNNPNKFYKNCNTGNIIICPFEINSSSKVKTWDNDELGGDNY